MLLLRPLRELEQPMLHGRGQIFARARRHTSPSMYGRITLDTRHTWA